MKLWRFSSTYFRSLDIIENRPKLAKCEWNELL
jgi:hypothetical protein